MSVTATDDSALSGALLNLSHEIDSLAHVPFLGPISGRACILSHCLASAAFSCLASSAALGAGLEGGLCDRLAASLSCLDISLGAGASHTLLVIRGRHSLGHLTGGANKGKASTARRLGRAGDGDQSLLCDFGDRHNLDAVSGEGTRDVAVGASGNQGAVRCDGVLASLEGDGGSLGASGTRGKKAFRALLVHGTIVCLGILGDCHGNGICAEAAAWALCVSLGAEHLEGALDLKGHLTGLKGDGVCSQTSVAGISSALRAQALRRVGHVHLALLVLSLVTSSGSEAGGAGRRGSLRLRSHTLVHLTLIQLVAGGAEPIGIDRLSSLAPISVHTVP
mmetsp:Transcript_8486/g.16547  ORF Transcript_8486/g.16547 Transcript_8486/m.16547 type:complete len:336 (+) Transcript_8486:1375-2382(+)